MITVSLVGNLRECFNLCIREISNRTNWSLKRCSILLLNPPGYYSGYLISPNSVSTIKIDITLSTLP